MNAGGMTHALKMNDVASQTVEVIVVLNTK
jgi:hypothetical protein